VKGCDDAAAFPTRTRPAWCDVHITQILADGGLMPLEPFTKRANYRLTRCLKCGCEAHYKFDYVLDRNAAGEPVCRACFWRKWAGKQRMLASIASTPVDLKGVRAHAERNGLDYLGPLTDPSLAEDPHRTQCRRCGKISAERVGDIGWGCSCRLNPKRQTEAPAVGTRKAQNLLRESGHAALEWWDHSLNSAALWDMAKLRSPKRAVWCCPTCGTRFTQVIREMTSWLSSRSCPTCRAAEQESRYRLSQERSRMTVADVPELVARWTDVTPPEMVPLLDSGYYVFLCGNGHRSTRRPESYLDGGCSYCIAAETRKANAAAAEKDDPGASRLSPEISLQWHPTRNGNLKLPPISPNSRRVTWWRDPRCGHEWQATPRERDKYQRLRCPECEMVLDSLGYLYPELAAEWAPGNSTTPWHVRPTASTWAVQPTWICPRNPEHRWQASPASRVRGSTCPECQEVGKSKVELAHMNRAQTVFGNASSGRRVSSEHFIRRGAWTVDILVDRDAGQRLAIEYDGAFWHADKAELDREKSLDLLAAGFTVVRLRESPSDSLAIDHSCYFEVVVYSHAPDAEGVIDRVKDLIDGA